MIHPEVKTAVESGDISSLKYHFCDCLDGDPTFSEYEEDYEYCKRNGILFVPHSELHPMNCNSVTDEYWVQLKKDFMQNPSVERMEHMREVAKILYSSRIRKIEEDNARKAASKPVHSSPTQSSATPSKPTPPPAPQQNIQSQPSIRKASEPAKTSDAIRRATEPVRPQSGAGRNTSGSIGSDGVRRVSEPINGSGVRRTSEPISNDGVRRASEPVRTAPTFQGTQPKKANGVGRIVAALVAVAVVLIVVICLINK